MTQDISDETKYRFPPINWHKINGVFNRTMTFRSDSDVVVRWDWHVTRDKWHVTRDTWHVSLMWLLRHGYIERRREPLSEQEVSKLYSKVTTITLSDCVLAMCRSHCPTSPTTRTRTSGSGGTRHTRPLSGLSATATLTAAGSNIRDRKYWDITRLW